MRKMEELEWKTVSPGREPERLEKAPSAREPEAAAASGDEWAQWTQDIVRAF